MTYRLSRLAPGSYDVLLDGVIIASFGPERRNIQQNMEGRASGRPPILDEAVSLHPIRALVRHPRGSSEVAWRRRGPRSVRVTFALRHTQREAD